MFQDEISKMWGLFREAQQEFVAFCEIVPYENNPDKVYSPKLYSILQSVGSQIAAMLRVVSKEIGLGVREDKFPAYYQALNSDRMLEIQKVTLRGLWKPFRPFDSEKPGWWVAYNETKHELPEGISAATMFNVVGALGGLTVLHQIGHLLLFRLLPGAGLSQQPNVLNDLLRSQNWRDFEVEFLADRYGQQGLRLDNGSGLQPLNLAVGAYLSAPPALEWPDQTFYMLTFFPQVFGNVKVV